MKKIIISILFIVTYSSLYPQFANYSNDFLNIGVGAKSLALGNASICNISGAEAVYINPSMIYNSNYNMNFSVMHSSLYKGLANYDYFGFSYILNDSLSIGLNLIRLGIDNIPNTLNLLDNNGNINYDNITYFSVADYALIFGFSRPLKIKNFVFGASSKIIYRNLGQFANAYGFGFDAALSYQHKNLKLSIVAKDITSTFNIWIYNHNELDSLLVNAANNIPENSIEYTKPQIYFASNYIFKLNSNWLIKNELYFSFSFFGKSNDLVRTKYLNFTPGFGSEISFKNNIFIRMGVKNFQWSKLYNKKRISFVPSIGCGISLFNFTLDYAITDVGNYSVVPLSNIISLSYQFKRK